MRNIFIKTLTEMAQKDRNIVLLTADMGYKIFDDFQSKCPDRFFNVGIAEQNMIGMASGLAMEGFKVFVYSIAPFVTLRCHEQIRNDVAYHKRDVIVVGFGGGYTYGHGGPTHHSIEDIAMFRAMPNMKIICPGDTKETERETKLLCTTSGPAYLRLSGIGGKSFENDYWLGKNVNILTTGNMLETGLKIKERLKQRQIDCGVISISRVKPLDKALIYTIFSEAPYMVTLEEHNICGGFGSSIAEFLMQQDMYPFLKMFGIKDKFVNVSGDSNYLRKLNGLDEETLEKEILKFIGFYNEK